MNIKTFCITFIGFFFMYMIPYLGKAQENELIDEQVDLFTEKSILDPNKAALYSAIVPGLGQIYNKQPWKLPFIYGGLFAVGYFVNYNNQYFNEIRNALSIVDDGLESPFPQLNRDALSTRSEQFRRDRDFLIIVGVGVYLLNIIDAHISAHLEEFAINDDLLVGLEPAFSNPNNGGGNIGLSLVLKFK